jgi:hypothetical protein
MRARAAATFVVNGPIHRSAVPCNVIIIHLTGCERAADFFHTRERRRRPRQQRRRRSHTLSLTTKNPTKSRLRGDSDRRLKGGGKEKRAPSRSVSAVGLRSPCVPHEYFDALPLSPRRIIKSHVRMVTGSRWTKTS